MKLRTSVQTSPYGNRENKINMVEDYLDSNLTLRDYSSIHNIPKSTLQNYVKKTRNPIDSLHDNAGHPSYVDDSELVELKDKVETLQRSGKTPNKRKFRALIDESHQESKRKRNEMTTNKPLDSRTIEKVKNRMHLNKMKPQFKSKARNEAEQDPRNPFTMIAMIQAFCSESIGEMIFNWDATQFTINENEGKCNVYCVPASRRFRG